jgi:anti-sigma regulatory factor (Ser/Thr protein kinase)
MATCPTELTDRAVLLVSELVTNAILHGAGRPQVTVELFDDGARISVADDDPSLPYRAPAGADATSGRGISIVEGIADEWGAEARGTGKRVWFEVRIASG